MPDLLGHEPTAVTLVQREGGDPDAPADVSAANVAAGPDGEGTSKGVGGGGPTGGGTHWQGLVLVAAAAATAAGWLAWGIFRSDLAFRAVLREHTG